MSRESMKRRKTKRFVILDLTRNLLFASFALFASCSSNDHAGVMSETESGQTVAGTVITSLGNPAAKTSIYVVASLFNAVRDSVLLKSETAEDGSFSLNLQELAAGSYTILFGDSTSDEIAHAKVTLTEDTLKLNPTLAAASQIAVSISAFDLSVGDTICILGTFACEDVDSLDFKSGYAYITTVPAAEYSTVQIFGNENETLSIDWKIDGGNTYLVNSTNADSAISVTKGLRYSNSDSFNGIPHVVENFAVLQNGSVAISFWAKLPKDAFGSDSNITLFSAMADSLGFVVRQNKTNNNKAIGVELFVDADSTVISDTTIYGSIKILDDTRHQIALLLNGKHITVMLDGETIRNTDFKLERGFGELRSFTFGDERLNGELDNLKIYDGTQDTTFMRNVYELEKITF